MPRYSRSELIDLLSTHLNGMRQMAVWEKELKETLRTFENNDHETALDIINERKWTGWTNLPIIWHKYLNLVNPQVAKNTGYSREKIVKKLEDYNKVRSLYFGKNSGYSSEVINIRKFPSEDKYGHPAYYEPIPSD